MRQTLEAAASYVAGAVGVVAALIVMLLFNGVPDYVVITHPWVQVAVGALGALMVLGLAVHYVRQRRRRAALLVVVAFGSGVLVISGLVLILKVTY